MRRLLVLIAALALCGYVGFQLYRDLAEAAALRHARAQVATLVQDAMARANRAGSAPAVQVVFSREGVLQEQIRVGEIWQQVRPAGSLSLALPSGVSVKEWTFPTNAMRAWRTAAATTEAWPGIIVLKDEQSETAAVQVGDTGEVTFQAQSAQPPSLQRAQAQLAAVFKDAVARTQIPVKIVLDMDAGTLTELARSDNGWQPAGPPSVSVLRLPKDIYIWTSKPRTGSVEWTFTAPESPEAPPRTIVLAACCGLTATVRLEQWTTAH